MIRRNDDVTTMCVVTAAVDAVWHGVIIAEDHFITVTLPTTVLMLTISYSLTDVTKLTALDTAEVYEAMFLLLAESQWLIMSQGHLATNKNLHQSPSGSSSQLA